MLKVLAQSIVRTAVAQVAMALLTWATEFRFKVVLIDNEDVGGAGDDTVH